MEEKRVVEYSDCLIKPQLSLIRILEIVQDAISRTLGSMGCDNVTLRTRYHAMWVFTKHKVHVEKALEWNEQYFLSCRSVKSGKLKNYMLTTFRDASGNVRAWSMLEGCILDTNDFKFRRLDSIPFISVNEEVDTEVPLVDIHFSETKQIKIEPLMIDYSQHMNNTESVKIFFNSFSLDKLNSILASSYDFCIHYTSQIRYGENITLQKGEEENLFAYSLLKEEGAVAVKANLTILE